MNKSKFNSLPPELIDELFKLMDDGMPVRGAQQWLLDKGIVFGKSTISRYYNGHAKYTHKPDRATEYAKLKMERQKQKNRAEERKEVKKLQKEAQRRVNKGGIAEKEDFELVNQSKTKPKVLFYPNEGPQEAFLAAGETDVLFGGAAGGGKSFAMVVDPLRYAHKRKHRAIILRRTLKELRQLIDISRELYPKAISGAKFKESEKTWKFPSGCQIEFNYLEKDSDVYQYQGQDFTWIGFDEITQLPTEFPWNYLASRLRTADPEIECYMRATANPGGVGHAWVKKRYVSPVEPGNAYVYSVNERTGEKLTRRFIPSKLSDNPHLYNDGRYEAMLQSLPENEKRRLLDGDWDVIDGAAFPEFDKEKHVIPPFDIPAGWRHIRSVDYGFAAPAAVLWAAVDPDDGTVIVYRELYQKGLTGEALAEKITEMETSDVQMGGVVDYAVFNRTGYKNTIGSVLNGSPFFLKLRPCNKDRKAGKTQIHERLSTRNRQRPGVQIFSGCVNLIREMNSIPLDKSDPEDVDTKVDDHAYDALRYMLMDLPKQTTIDEFLLGAKRDTHYGYAPADPILGY